MHAADFHTVIHDGAVFCLGCLPEGVDPEGEDVHPVFADSEWDSYPTCDHCGLVHDYVTLTERGRRQRWLRLLNPDLRRLAESNKDELPAFAWPGGYPLYYLDRHASVLCPKCANNAVAAEEDLPVVWGTHSEGEPLPCENCMNEIASACGPVED